MRKNKTLLIGWDAAEWKVIHELLDQNLMPNVKKLMDEGASGNIKTLDPPLSPMLWTSIATGKLADKHGVLGFTSANEETGEMIPIHSSQRKTHAIWNILHREGYKCNVINWWPSHPVDPIDGVMVSNFFAKESRLEDGSWPLDENDVHPASVREELKALRVPKENIIGDDLLKFVPEGAKVDQTTDPKLDILRKLIAETLSTQKVAEWTLKNTDWDFSAIYFDGMDKLSHLFMKFRPPQSPHIPDDEFELYKYVIDTVYIMFDNMLGYLLERTDDQTNIVLLSDHGFHADHLRVGAFPKFHASLALEHNPNGVLIAKGPAFKKGTQIQGASLLDITPTLLKVLNHPVGEDMDGKTLESILSTAQETKFIESWDELSGDFARNMEVSDNVSSASLQQLIDLGYVEEMIDDKELQLAKVSNNEKYHLSKVFTSTGRFDKAQELLEELHEKDKVDPRWNLDLIHVCLSTNQTNKARSIFDRFKKVNVEDTINIQLIEATILQKENRYDEALKIFHEMSAQSPKNIGVHLEMGNVYRSMRQFGKSEEAFRRALKYNPKSDHALHGIAMAKLRQNDFDGAADYALQAIEINYQNYGAHYHFGEALYQLELYEEAAHALEVCLTINPAVNRARNLLITIYTDHLGKSDMAHEHQELLSNPSGETITVVSGLPRSGTSMMMQMLHAGGMEVLTDGKREADESNPKGYFEFEPVKRVIKDDRWLPLAEGKAVKVIAQLLKTLKLKYNYKIIFMRRNLDDVLISQETMLTRIKPNKTAVNYDLTIIEQYKKTLEEVKAWEKSKHNVEILYLDYEDVVQHPLEAAKKVNQFLNNDMDTEAMSAMVDKSLHRIKANEK